MLLLCQVARGEDDRQPPPDPQKGEPADGRKPAPRVADDLLLVPRLILAPPRLLWKALSVPVKSGGDAMERHHVLEWIYLALTSPDGAIGVRPQFTYAQSFSPFFGLMFFHRRLLGPGTQFDATLEGSGFYDSVIARVHARPTPSFAGPRSSTYRRSSCAATTSSTPASAKT